MNAFLRLIILGSTKPNFVHVLSPLSPQDCAGRVNAVLKSATGGFKLWNTSPIFGSASDGHLRLRRNTGTRNSFQQDLDATMAVTKEGTVIRGKMDPSPLTTLFMILWCGALMVMGVPCFLTAATSYLPGGSPGDREWIGLVGPPAMLAFALMLRAAGGLGVEGDAAFLRDFLIRTLDGKEIPSPPPLPPGKPS